MSITTAQKNMSEKVATKVSEICGFSNDPAKVVKMDVREFEIMENCVVMNIECEHESMSRSMFRCYITANGRPFIFNHKTAKPVYIFYGGEWKVPAIYEAIVR